MNSKELGIYGENLIAQRLQKQGYTIIARNYRQRYGEIDLIACKGNQLSFVEVKTRSNRYFDLAQVINYTKQQRMIKTAQHFLIERGYYDKVCQFDVALIEPHHGTPRITYIPDAFMAEE